MRLAARCPGRGAAAWQARAVRPPPSPGAAARSCAGLGADAAAVLPRSSLVTELRGTCSLLRSLSPPPLRSPPPASRPHRRARGGPGAATQRPAPPPAPHPPGRACARGTTTPRAPSQARRGAPPASSVPGREGEVTPATSLAAIRPPRRAEPGGGGPGRSDVNEAEARLGEIHSFDTDLLGAGEAWEQARRGPSPDGAGAGGEDTSLQDVTCGGGWGGHLPRPGEGDLQARGREGGWLGTCSRPRKPGGGKEA